MHSRGSMKILALACVLVSGCAVEAGGDEVTGEAQQALQAFNVQFSDVVETIGIDLVPTEEARAFVPEEYVLAGEGSPVTPLVVRTAYADGVSVNGGAPTSGSVVQIGAIIAPPDGTGDVNNYILWYYTDNPQLAYRLNLAGIHAQYVPNLEYDYSLDAGDNHLHVRVPFPGSPRFAIDGTVTPPTAAPVPFVSNWWTSSCGTPVKQVTTIESLFISESQLSLQTRADNALGSLLGSSTAEFAVLDNYNQFPAGYVTVAPAPF